MTEPMVIPIYVGGVASGSGMQIVYETTSLAPTRGPSFVPMHLQSVQPIQPHPEILPMSCL